VRDDGDGGGGAGQVDGVARPARQVAHAPARLPPVGLEAQRLPMPNGLSRSQRVFDRMRITLLLR